MRKDDEEGIFVFDTRIGPCGIAWAARGIDHVQLPAESAKATVALLIERTGGRAVVSKPTKPIRRVASRIQNHLAGKPDPLSDISIDLGEISDFATNVYQALRKVRPGKIITYGELAEKAGSPNAARAVGVALAANPMPLIIPCHRVVTADMKPGGFSAPNGLEMKVQILFIEGVNLKAMTKER